MPSQIEIDALSDDDDDKSGKSKPKSSKPKSRSTTTAERELRGRLAACFERIAASLEQRGDDELAEIVRDDAEIMSQGLVSLTRPFRALRTPLLAAVAIVEPVLAFGRIFRVLAGRFVERRAARAEEEPQPVT